MAGASGRAPRHRAGCRQGCRGRLQGSTGHSPGFTGLRDARGASSSLLLSSSAPVSPAGSGTALPAPAGAAGAGAPATGASGAAPGLSDARGAPSWLLSLIATVGGRAGAGLGTAFGYCTQGAAGLLGLSEQSTEGMKNPGEVAWRVQALCWDSLGTRCRAAWLVSAPRQTPGSQARLLHPPCLSGSQSSIYETHTPRFLARDLNASGMRRAWLLRATLLALLVAQGLTGEHQDWPNVRLRTRTISTR